MTLATSVVICAYTEARWEQLCEAVTSVQDAASTGRGDHRRDRPQRRPARPRPGRLPDGLGAGERVHPGPLRCPQHRHRRLHRRHRLLPGRRRGRRGRTGARTCSLRTRTRAILGVGGAATPAWETAEPAWWPGEFGWVVGCSYRGQPTTTSPVRNLMGCNMSLRRTVLAAVGWLRHRAGSPRRQPARLRGDRALHPGGTAVSRRRLPARAGGRRAPSRTGQPGVLALLP